MSRLFDALQEAARFRGANGTPGETVWKELGISSTAAPEVEQDGPGVRGAPEARATISTVDTVLEDLPATPGFDIEMPPVVPYGGAPARILLDKKARLIPHTADTIVVERYRMLRTKILQEREKKFFRSLVITSASPQEGKTVTTLNLALSFAALPSFRILVVDGDMRRGTLGEWLGIDKDRPGLSNLIEGSAKLEQVLLKSDELSMCVIPRGNAQVNDLHPSQFSVYFRHLADQFDLVLVDSPPVNIITDVQIMAASCDAVLLVARAFSTTAKGLEEAVDKLQSFRVIGAVLNAGTPQRSRRYHGYY
jgi:protein-tyrosine kinase